MVEDTDLTERIVERILHHAIEFSFASTRSFRGTCFQNLCRYHLFFSQFIFSRCDNQAEAFIYVTFLFLAILLLSLRGFLLET